MIKNNQNFLEINMNVIDIRKPLEKKRATYLTFYKDGIFDGIFVAFLLIENIPVAKQSFKS